MKFVTLQRSKIILFALAVSVLFATQALAEEFIVTNRDGDRLSVVADFPSGNGPHAAIVLAPGQGYHMHLPALEVTARALTEQGVAVFRFNWTYFTARPQGQPSDDLSKELQDIQAVIAAARKHPKVLASNVSVGGKSLGSLVAWRALAADPGLRSGLFLTPVCSRVPEGSTSARSEAQENYPGFQSERRPTLAISGNRDPLCAPAMLYQFAAASVGPARVAIVGGDHSFEDKTLLGAAANAARTKNIAAVSVLAASFVAETASTWAADSATTAPAVPWPTTGWQQSTPEQQGMDSTALRRIVEYGAQNAMDSLLVVRHGKLMVDAYYAPYREGQKHAIYSATKAVVGTLTGIAIKDGLLQSVNQRVMDFFADQSAADADADRRKSIHIEHLLDMTSGIN